MSDKTKKKCTVYLDLDTIKRADACLAAANCKSRSELSEKALKFYMGFLGSRDTTLYQSKTLTATLNGIVSQNTDRLSSLIFKLAVEVAMMTHVIGANMNYDEDNLRALRGKCVKDVKSTFGKVNLDEAIKFQHGNK